MPCLSASSDMRELFEQVLASLWLELAGKEWQLPRRPCPSQCCCGKGHTSTSTHLAGYAEIERTDGSCMAVIGGLRFLNNAHPQSTPLDQAPKKWQIEISCSKNRGGAAVGSGRVTAGRN